jgi:hypothetical protein
MISGNTNFATVMIGERAVDMVRQKMAATPSLIGIEAIILP